MALLTPLPRNTSSPWVNYTSGYRGSPNMAGAEYQRRTLIGLLAVTLIGIDPFLTKSPPAVRRASRAIDPAVCSDTISTRVLGSSAERAPSPGPGIRALTS